VSLAALNERRDRAGILGGSARGLTLRMGALGALLCALYWWVVRDLVFQWWDDPNYSHGFLVPLFSGYLVWQDRDAIRRRPTRPSWLGLPVLLVAVSMLVLGVVGAENFLMRASLIVMIAGLVLFHLGGATLRAIAFPLAFLAFMVPLPEIVLNAVAFPLQGIAAQNATSVLEALGVPVLRDGNVIHLSRITLGVTEACSGIRSLVSLLALATASAYVGKSPRWAMAVLVVSAVPITIVANAARIVLTGLIGQWLGVRYAQGFFHAFSGWLIFLVALVCLIAVHAALSLATGARNAGAARR